MVRDTTVGSDRSERAVEPAETEGEENGAFQRWRTETQRALNEADAARVDVYVRSLLPPPGAKEGQVDVMRRLEGLADESIVDDVTVNVWGERICLCEDCRSLDTGRMLVNAVRELRRWGGEYDASTRRFFERHESASGVTGNSYDGIVPPRIACALYVDGSLAGVFPSEFGKRPVSVHDFCAAMTAGTEREAAADSPDGAATVRSGPSE